MNSILIALLTVALAWPPVHYGETNPETDAQRQARIELIASVNTEVAHSNIAGFDPRDSAALLLAIQIHESKLDYYVHAGLESPIGHQDHGKARCLGQIHTWPGNPHLPTKTDHQALAGIDREATTRCAETMLRYLWGHARRCLKRTSWTTPLADYEVAFIAAAYGSGYCTPVKASSKARARTFRRIRRAM
jgi:hypothetical protein